MDAILCLTGYESSKQKNRETDNSRAEPAALQRGIPLEPAHYWHPSAHAAELAWGRLLVTGCPGALKLRGETQAARGWEKKGRHDNTLRSSLIPYLLPLGCHFHLGAGMGIEGLPSSF